MPTLKEIKERIRTVNSTHKITAAMKMVASAKLHKIQAVSGRTAPYSEVLNRILNQLLSAGNASASLYTGKRELKHVSVLVISSNASLCGTFNSNIIHTAERVYKELKVKGAGEIVFYTLGKMVTAAIKRGGYQLTELPSAWLDHLDYDSIAVFCNRLICNYQQKITDHIEIIYTYPQSASHPVVVNKVLFPCQNIPVTGRILNPDYVIEPSATNILQLLIPEVFTIFCYSALLNSCIAEHTSRLLVMQTATDNAEALLYDLNVSYNRMRQYKITGELLDMAGGRVMT